MKRGPNTQRRRMTTEEKSRLDDSAKLYSGQAGCPECGGGAGRVVNVGRCHWAFCRNHKVKWTIGCNLFSSWKAQKQDEQRRIYDELGLGEYRSVTEKETT